MTKQGKWQGTASHVLALAFVLIGYILIRVVWAPQYGFARDHLTGVAIPRLVALFFMPAPAWRNWVETLSGKMAIVISAAIVWECLVPLWSEHSTADPIDALCYLRGAVVQHAFVWPFGHLRTETYGPR